MAAGVLFRDGAGRVLMLRPTYKEGWDIPGGNVEPGESPSAAAAREVKEELGVDRAVGRLLVVDWAPHPDEGDKLLFVVDGGPLAGHEPDGFSLQAEEVAEARFQTSEAFASLTS
jgi:8-oxo-dGTP diphosphatase